ncbi:nitrophenyl compound nitroreductase subunit ArsF family protein [bacterium]|nr:nitrophenyl compound nitroreductase subunit ArsF family protein [bacterium]
MKNIPIYTVLILTCAFLFYPAITTAQTQSESTPDSIVSIQDNTVHKLMVYYFHGKKRCMSCRTIEGYTHDVLLTDFADKLESGRIEWQIVNTANPKNAHFKQDFELYTQSVVLVDMVDGEMKRWKNLKDVWTLLRNKEAFYEYINSEVTAFLAADK